MFYHTREDRNPAHPSEKLKATSKLLSLLVGLISILVLAGWCFSIDLLIQIHPAFAPMQFNTALCFLLSSSALIGMMQKHLNLLIISSIAAMTISALTLSQYLLQINLGLDELLMKAHTQVKTSHPGRMAPNTAVCFILINLALALPAKKSEPHQNMVILSTLLTLFTFALAAVALLGYISGIESGYGWAQLTRMALHTAIGFCLLSIALLMLLRYRWQSSLERNYLPVTLAILLSTMSIVLWQSLGSHEHQQLKHRVELNKEQFQSSFQRLWAQHFHALERLALRLEMLEKQNNVLWKADTATYLKQLPALTAMAIIDPDDSVRLTSPSPAYRNIFSRLDLFSFPPEPNDNLQVSWPIRTLGDNQEMLILLPLNVSYNNPTASSELTRLAILVNAHKLVSELIEHYASRHYAIEILANNKPFFSVGEGQPNYWTDPDILLLGPTKWHFRFSLTRKGLNQYGSAIPETVLFSGIFMSLLLAAFIHFYRTSRLQANKLRTEVRERQHFERELMETRDRLSLAAHVSGLGIWQWDLKTDKLIWDHRMHQIYETPEDLKEELIYDFWHQSVHPEDITDTATGLQNAVQGKHVWRSEFRLQLPDSRIKFIKAHASPVLDENHEVIRMIGGNLDVSEQRNLELHLLDAKKQAEAANRAKSDFLANMSHEIRTPMNGVLGITELLHNTNLDTRQQEYLNLITNSARSLLSILNDILDLSKIEAGHLELEKVTFPLDKHIGDVVKGFSPSAHNKELALHYYLDPALPAWITADPVRIGQILFNLVGNAIKFTSRGHVTVEALATNKVPNAINEPFMLQLKVTDSGKGISKEKQASIFTAFSQEDTSITRKYGGTGLGLTIVKQLTKLMGGNIDLESETDKGTTVTVTLPVNRGEPNFGSIEATPWLKQSNPLANIRCLAVDDNYINRRWLRDMIESWGSQVDLAESATQALELLRAASADDKPYNIMLVDKNMPVMSGLDLIEKMRSEPLTAPEIIIMLSSSDKSEDIKRLESLGMDHYLMKPVKQSEVFNSILSLLNPDARPYTGPESDIKPDRTDESQVEHRILVAEDNPVNQRLVSDILIQAGYKVSIVDNGEAARDAALSEQHDLVLMDVQMPVMDGLQATREIRENETNSHQIIVGLTAHALSGDRERCLEAGMDEYLTKPIAADELNSTIKGLLNDQSSQTPLAAESSPTSESAKFQYLDLAKARRVSGNNAQRLNTIIQMTLEHFDETVADIGHKIRNRELRDAATRIHKFKGSLSLLSSDTLVGELVDAEAELEATNVPDPDVRWEEILHKLHILKGELEMYLRGDNGNSDR